MITIDNNIYDSTLLEGIPFKLKYRETRPKNVYKVDKSGITTHNYREWINLPEKPTLSKLRNLFLHDTSHAVLYHLRGEDHRLLKSDFGLTWDHVKYVNDEHNLFANRKERIDEYKIAAIHQILFASLDKRSAPTYVEMKQIVARAMNYVWHVKKITPAARKQKRKEIAEACDYICKQIGAKQIRNTARSLIKHLQENV